MYFGKKLIKAGAMFMHKPSSLRPYLYMNCLKMFSFFSSSRSSDKMTSLSSTSDVTLSFYLLLLILFVKKGFRSLKSWFLSMIFFSSRKLNTRLSQMAFSVWKVSFKQDFRDLGTSMKISRFSNILMFGHNEDEGLQTKSSLRGILATLQILS